MKNEKQIFKSERQLIMPMDGSGHYTSKSLRTITIENGEFIMELPNNKILKGTLTFQQTTDDKTDVYITDKDCPFAISSISVLINQSAINKEAIVFYLGDQVDEMYTEAENNPKPKEGKSLFGKLFGS